MLTTVVLIAGVTISGTSCLGHITVQFGAEAPDWTERNN